MDTRPPRAFRFEGYRVDTVRRQLIGPHGLPIPLTSRAYEVLLHLIENRDRVVTRTELNQAVWGGRIVTDSALNSCIKAARHAIGDDGKSQARIRTVHRTGYRFIGPVAEQPEAHLLPHVERLCRERGWKLTRSDVVDAVLEVDVSTPHATVRSSREAAFAVLGTFAEASTHVVERPPDVGRATELVATTGMLEGDSSFAPHGHTVRIRVVLV